VSQGTIPQPGSYAEDPYQDTAYVDDLNPEVDDLNPEVDDLNPDDLYPDEGYVESRAKRRSIDYWMAQRSTTFPRFKRRSIALFFLRLPAFVPWIFIMRGWLSLNAKDTLSLVEADVLGSGGELAFLIAVSITPLITLTGARWFAPLRRWYGIFFALIGISDATTAAITTTFSGGVFGRLAGHTFLVTGLFIVLLAAPLLFTANTPAQRWMGTWWKKLQKMTYLIWGFIILHLALLDGFRPFDGPQGDGDPVFHDRFYQILAISLPLVLLRLPPVKRWVIEKREAGEQWKVWATLAPMLALYVVGFLFIINEEIFTGTMAITLRPPSN
jgi:DMSO/TMAO reductase YedYZ heme-binding membrane subunit